MLRSDREIALDEALLAAAEAGRLYRESALRSERFRQSLTDAAALRDRISQDLAQAARKAGWLPAGPDPDLETARELTDEIRLAIEPETAAPLAEERRMADHDALNKLTRLLEMKDLPAPVAEAASGALARLRTAVVE